MTELREIVGEELRRLEGYVGWGPEDWAGVGDTLIKALAGRGVAVTPYGIDEAGLRAALWDTKLPEDHQDDYVEDVLGELVKGLRERGLALVEGAPSATLKIEGPDEELLPLVATYEAKGWTLEQNAYEGKIRSLTFVRYGAPS